VEFFLSYYIGVIFISIAVIHIYWGLGGVWPVKSEEALIDAFVGHGDKLPSQGAFIVVIMIFLILGIMPILEVHHVISRERLGLELFYRVVSLVLFIRAMSMFIPSLKKRATATFYHYNKYYYAPLITTLALSYGLLSL